MEIYGSPAAFVNVGGAEANLGISPRILDVPPGLSEELELPPEEERGVLSRWQRRASPSSTFSTSRD